ncbi:MULTISPECIES: hypothetical protein [Pseudomonas]|jgi:hypothetical protein|uniref:hypothetical protein n=1 Tax=Pseudomonas TaxID=286 RepID=UPI0017846D7E|nr:MULTISPECIES: hypothetical protein [Pseudomonas]MBD9606149.1 hypothetical protein [Pseudomonas sp. PDM08]MDR7109979.1 hypothetical protein [Pseudomonas frederiksbergensis]
MKGKRKVKTTKWLLKGRYIYEAELLMNNRSQKAHRFLDAALQLGAALEPIGRLAGDMNR